MGGTGGGLLPFPPLPFRTERCLQMTPWPPEIPTSPCYPGHEEIAFPETLEDAMESATNLSIWEPQREKLIPSSGDEYHVDRKES